MHKPLTDLQLKKETAYKVETVLFKTGFAFWFDKRKFATQSVTVTLDSIFLIISFHRNISTWFLLLTHTRKTQFLPPETKQINNLFYFSVISKIHM